MWTVNLGTKINIAKTSKQLWQIKSASNSMRTCTGENVGLVLYWTLAYYMANSYKNNKSLICWTYSVLSYYLSWSFIINGEEVNCSGRPFETLDPSIHGTLIFTMMAET